MKRAVMTIAVALCAAGAFGAPRFFLSERICAAPEAVTVEGDGFTNALVRTGENWTDAGVTVNLTRSGDGAVAVDIVAPGKGLSFVRLKMKESFSPEVKVLNDAWERSYGDLEWQTLGKNTIYSPWYFLAEKNGTVQGFGVETGPASMCCWEVATNGVTLVLDVRAGGRPVRLNGRTLKACRIVRAESIDGETPWQFGRRFCRMMCPNPKLPKDPVYGYNDWYCAYGKNTATNFLADAEYVVACAKGCENPPYVVMDDGWQKNSPPVVGESGRGPWDAAGPNFGMEMPEFCRAIVALGAKPGLWYRPLRAWDELPEEQRLVSDRDYLDPTVPSVRSRIVADMKRFREWGFKLVKIDFLSFDISQLWPCDPHPHHDRFIQDDRAWRDDTRTTAEVMLDLYRAMKDAAGDDVVIIGCNALNHLAAGVFELQRTGNDTSGKDWNWTRKNGVNTLAMRSIQDGAFFKIDADCVGLASEGAVPWNLNRQWMELLGRSGTPFFVSWKRELATPEVRAALADAFKCASSDRETAEPVDWIKTRQPRRWHLADGTAEYDWLAFCDCALGSEYGRPTGELQEKAQALADLAVKEGMQGALQFCAFKDGKCIVDVWAGTMTTNAGAAKIDGDTLFPIFSTEKPLLATAMHRSVEQGKLEYDKPVCKYWPEFRGGGKENLTVRELMGYRSGLPDRKPGVEWHDVSTMSDWQGMLEWYASCKPEIEPGTKQRYMPKSYGWALGGLLEKAWGRPANDILREQVLVPAGIEKDFYFVCGDDEIPRIATAYHGAAFETMNNDIARRSLLPSAWAVSSARGIAKFYNRLCGFDGKPPLIGRETLDAALKPCRHESDPLPDAEGLKKWHMIFGMGYGLWGESDDISRVFGHGGVGGSEGLCDRSQKLVIGYTCNFDNAPPKLREAFYSLVGMRWRYWKDDVNIQDLQMSTVAKGDVTAVEDRCAWFQEARFGMFIHWATWRQ